MEGLLVGAAEEHRVGVGAGGRIRIACHQIFWAVLCLPAVTIGPATAALYYTVVKCVRGRESGAFGYFFRSFLQNFKVGLLAGLIAIPLALLLFGGHFIVRWYGTHWGGWAYVLYVAYYFALTLPADDVHQRAQPDPDALFRIKEFAHARLLYAFLRQRLAHGPAVLLRLFRVPADELAEESLHHIELGHEGGGGAELEGLFAGPAQQHRVGVGAGGGIEIPGHQNQFRARRNFCGGLYGRVF